MGWERGSGGKNGGADWDQGSFGLKEVNTEEKPEFVSAPRRVWRTGRVTERRASWASLVSF